MSAPGFLQVPDRNTVNAWIFVLGVSFPVSMALRNIVAFGGVVILLGFAIWQRQLRLSTYHWAVAGILFFFFISEVIHDQALSHTGSLLLTFLVFTLAGQIIQKASKPQVITFLFYGLLIGILIGFGIDAYRRPEYPYWAVNAAKYTNDAAFIVLICLFLSLLKRIRRQLLAVPLCLIFIVMTGSKSTILALVGGGFIFFLTFHGKKYAAIFGLASITILALLAAIPMQNSAGREMQLDVNRIFSANETRVDFWIHGLRIAQHDHWLGRGELEFTQTEMESVSEWLPAGRGPWKSEMLAGLRLEDGYYIIPFHSLLMQTLVDHGAAGLLAIIFFFLLPLIFIIRRRPIPSIENAVGLAVWTAFIIHSAFEVGLDNTSAILVGLIAGLTGLFGIVGDLHSPHPLAKKDRTL